MDITENNTENINVEDLSRTLFLNPPSEPLSKNIMPVFIDYENGDNLISYNFEFLIKIYMEGLMHLMNNMENVTKRDIFYTMTETDLMYPNDWFKSFGYMIHIRKLNHEQLNMTSDYYTQTNYFKIFLPFNDQDSFYFENNILNGEYAFVKNKSYCESQSLNNINAMMVRGDDIFIIYFADLTNNR